MEIKNREALLKIAVGVVCGIWLFDKLVLTPATNYWTSQGEQIDTLRRKVQNGRQLVQREASLRAHWAQMQRDQLPDDLSAAENSVIKAMGQWAKESRVNFTSYTSGHRKSDNYETMDCRATATGDQASLGHLIYAMETDPLPIRMEECELAARDPKGQQLNLTLKFSLIRFTDQKGAR